MSIPTLAASRVYLSELRNQSGIESSLSFDKFPFSGLSKVSRINNLDPLLFVSCSVEGDKLVRLADENMAFDLGNTRVLRL